MNLLQTSNMWFWTYEFYLYKKVYKIPNWVIIWQCQLVSCYNIFCSKVALEKELFKLMTLSLPHMAMFNSFLELLPPPPLFCLIEYSCSTHSD